MLRMAIEYFPRTYANAPSRYLLMAYGQAGKVLFQAPYQSLNTLFEALSAAGISLEKEEEQTIREGDIEFHYVLVADKIHLSDSQISSLGLKPKNFE